MIPSFQQRAGDFYGLFVANLYDKRTQALGEYFEDDWSRIEPVSGRARPSGRVVLAAEGL